MPLLRHRISGWAKSRRSGRVKAHLRELAPIPKCAPVGHPQGYRISTVCRPQPGPDARRHSCDRILFGVCGAQSAPGAFQIGGDVVPDCVWVRPSPRMRGEQAPVLWRRGGFRACPAHQPLIAPILERTRARRIPQRLPFPRPGRTTQPAEPLLRSSRQMPQRPIR